MKNICTRCYHAWKDGEMNEVKELDPNSDDYNALLLTAQRMDGCPFCKETDWSIDDLDATHQAIDELLDTDDL
ncbi:MAG: hypothetical protein OEV93_04810 [Candidatus Moranbacteria bacterium]|nr:hypothetical protein [Candidatus Moranbacteria bacterium]